MMSLKRTCALLAVTLAGATAAAQDYGDAPASYGLASANASFNERLGVLWDADATNPVTPAWTGDGSDDGVSSPPAWVTGGSNNSVSIDVDTDGYTQYLSMWIDLNDDGDFNDAGERIDHPSFPTDVSGTYTFTGITIPWQNYALNGSNKIGVRFILKFNSPITGPDDNFSYGEVEDYLFDVIPTGFVITNPATLPNGGYGTSYRETLQTFNGTGPITWQLAGGSLPPGLSLSASGDITGTPTSAAAGVTYSFDVTATDSSSPVQTHTKSFTLHVDSLLISGGPSLASAFEGQPYSHTFTVVHGASPYSWAVVSGSPPSGLTPSQVGDDFVLSGTPGTGTGDTTYGFTIEVTSGTISEQKSFILYVFDPPETLPYVDDFSVDRGWTLGSGQGVTWEIDVCGQAYNPGFGNPEPTVDHSPSSDNRILGDNIGATYPNGMTGTVWAESPAVDCLSVSNVGLVFWRWLNVENSQYDHAYIEVSPDNGLSWIQVWENQSDITDNSWVEQRIDISSVAGNQGAVKVRFGIGPTDSSWSYAGWCIDDLEIIELPSTNKLILADFEIDSNYSIAGDPSCFTGGQYSFDLTFDNTTSNDIQVDSVDFAVTEFSSTNPENVGTWTLSVTVPFIVPANTTGHVVSGTFDCASLSSSGANATLVNVCSIQGTEQVTNKPVVTEFSERFYVDNGPPPTPPSLEVHEISYQGPLVVSGQSAAGTNRDFGSMDIDAGAAGWVNIVLFNGTSGDVDVNVPKLVGLDAAHFRLDTSQWAGTTMTLTPSSQIYFSVNFNPHDLGQLDAQVEFTHTSSEPGANPIVVPFTGAGTGNAPELEMHEFDYQGPQITHGQPAAGTNRDFGTAAAGGSSQWLNVALWNRFVSDTTIDPLPVITGADAAEFEIDTSQMNSPHVIPGDPDFTGTTYFSIRFAPTAGSVLGTKTATVSFGHNASSPVQPSLSFEIMGEVTQAGPNLSVYELDGSGNPSTTIVNGAPATGRRDFGPQNIIAGPTGYLEVEILNTGTATLTLGTPRLIGPHAPDFVIDTTSYSPAFSSSVAPSAATRFRVAFNPSATGTRDATVEFTHNSIAAASPFTFDVTGTGMPNAPVMSVHEGSTSGPVIAYNAAAAGTSRAFGNRDINAGASVPLTIVVQNSGYQDLNLGTPTLAGADPGDFVITANGFPAVVAPQGTAAFSVAFHPSSFGNKVAEVRFAHNDPQVVSPFSFEVTGFGDAPVIEVREGSTAGPVLTSGDEIDFGPVQLAVMPGLPVVVVIANVGNADLVMPSPSLSGTNAADFILSAPGFPHVVSPNDDVSFTVAFNASQVGIKKATVNIGYYAGGPRLFTLELTGKAEDPNGVAFASPSVLEDARGGEPYAVTMQAVGGTPPYAWAVRNGSLPPGMSLSNSGVISGRPNDAAATYTFELRVTDAQGGTDDNEFSISVIGNPFNGSSPGRTGCGSASGGTPFWALLVLLGAAALGRRGRILTR